MKPIEESRVKQFTTKAAAGQRRVVMVVTEEKADDSKQFMPRVIDTLIAFNALNRAATNEAYRPSYRLDFPQLPFRYDGFICDVIVSDEIEGALVSAAAARELTEKLAVAQEEARLLRDRIAEARDKERAAVRELIGAVQEHKKTQLDLNKIVGQCEKALAERDQLAWHAGELDEALTTTLAKIAQLYAETRPAVDQAAGADGYVTTAWMRGEEDPKKHAEAEHIIKNAVDQIDDIAGCANARPFSVSAVGTIEHREEQDRKNRDKIRNLEQTGTFIGQQEAPGPTIGEANKARMDWAANASPAPAAITPTIGRKVWYWPSDGDKAGFRRPIDEIWQQPVVPEQPLDATVVYVRGSGNITLSIVDHEGKHHTRYDVPLFMPIDESPNGPRRPYATWPPQAGQAKKS